MENLRVDTIDLYLIHWPLPRLDAFAAYEELLEIQEEGLIDEVGVSNFKPSHIQELLAATGRPPAVNQIQLDPRRARLAARKFHASLGIMTQAWSPLKDNSLFDEPAVKAAAMRHGVSCAQVLLAWHIRNGVVPLVMSSSPIHQAENLRSVDYSWTR